MILTMMMMIQKIYRSHKPIVMVEILMGLKVAMTPMLMRLVTGNGDSDERKRTTAQG